MQIVQIPQLHPKQEEIFRDVVKSKRRFSVVNCGRRFGKTYLALALAIEFAVNRGKTVWWLAPAFSTSNSHWQIAKYTLAGVYTQLIEKDKRMEFIYDDPDTGETQHGQIVFRSADKPDLLRGTGIDLLVIDEAAFCSEEVWKIMRPALADRRGHAIFISTPNGLNWFQRLYQNAEAHFEKAETHGLKPKWRAWHFTSYDNPFIPAEEIDDAKETMNENDFRQEHLAEFFALDSAVFRNVKEVSTVPMARRPVAGHTYSMGVDWGRKSDATVISVIDMDTQTQVWMDRFTETRWTFQRHRVAAAAKLWNPAKIYIEENAAGQPVIEQLMEEGVKNIIPFFTTQASKFQLIESLSLAMDRQEILLLDPEDHPYAMKQYKELLAYEMKQKNNTTGNGWAYSAPKGQNDDTVIALALAWQALVKKDSNKVVVNDNPFYKRPDDHNKPKKTFRSMLDRYRKKPSPEILAQIAAQNGDLNARRP